MRMCFTALTSRRPLRCVCIRICLPSLIWSSAYLKNNSPMVAQTFKAYVASSASILFQRNVMRPGFTQTRALWPPAGPLALWSPTHLALCPSGHPAPLAFGTLALQLSGPLDNSMALWLARDSSAIFINIMQPSKDLHRKELPLSLKVGTGMSILGCDR